MTSEDLKVQQLSENLGASKLQTLICEKLNAENRRTLSKSRFISIMHEATRDLKNAHTTEVIENNKSIHEA